MARSVFDLFLSSTSKDLAECRAKVTEMIERMGQVAVRMERFGAKPNKPLAVCREEVESCDALIVIVGHRYGWIPGKRDGGDGHKSITCWEVEWALKKKIPVYSFLIDPAAKWTGEREQDRLIDSKGRKEYVEVGQAVRYLQEFRKSLGKQTTWETFSSAEDLGGKVATSLHDWLLRKQVEAALSSYEDRGEQLALPSPAPAAEGTLASHESLYWQEQAHVLSAQQIAGKGEGVKIALIAGRANADHPALAGSSINQFDVEAAGHSAGADHYTTVMAALLVGKGAAPAYAGVAPGASLLVLTVLDDNMVTSQSAIKAAVEVALLEGARVICLSLGGFARSKDDEAFFRRAARRGAILVCAAGNNSQGDPIFPGGYPGCLAVGAVTRQGVLASFSNHGPWLATTAPGTEIPAAAGSEGYQNWSGTSLSCGIAAGVVALMLRANPDLTAAQVNQILRSTGSVALKTDSRIAALGDTRVLDAHEAVLQAAELVKPAKTPGSRTKRA